MKNFMKLVISSLIFAAMTGCAGLNQQGNNALAGAGLGALVGGIAGDTRIAAERGAVAGAILGLLVPVTNNNGQQVAVRQVAQNGQQVVSTNGCVQAVVDGVSGCYSPAYLQTLQRTGQQQQQQVANSGGCVQAVVDGVSGCYSPAYLQTLQRTGQQQQQQQQQLQRLASGNNCPQLYTPGVGWGYKCM